MGKHLLDETAEFKMPRMARHAAADDSQQPTQRFDPGPRPESPAVAALRDLIADSR